MLEGSKWFKKLVKDCAKVSSHITFVRVKYGFYRVYWTGGGEPAYIHEVYKWMPAKGYDMEITDPRFESLKYFQEFEDRDEIVMKVKNFVEGYYDSMETILKRVRMFRNDKEFRDNATKSYRNMAVK